MFDLDNRDINSKKKNNYAILMVDLKSDYLSVVDPFLRELIIDCNVSIVEELCIEEKIPLVTITNDDKGTFHKDLQSVINSVSKYVELSKSEYDGFSNPKLNKYLEKWSTNKLIITGVSAPCCVQRTSETGVRYYDVLTAEQLVAPQLNDVKRMPEFLKWFKSNGTYFSNYRTLIDVVKENINN